MQGSWIQMDAAAAAAAAAAWRPEVRAVRSRTERKGLLEPRDVELGVHGSLLGSEGEALPTLLSEIIPMWLQTFNGLVDWVALGTVSGCGETLPRDLPVMGERSQEALKGFIGLRMDGEPANQNWVSG